MKEATGSVIDLDAIPLTDKKVLDGFAGGHTQGVFQLESGSMRKLLKDLGGGIDPMSFETVVATTALFRPGPIESGMLDSYVSVAKGFKEADSIHQVLDELTSETNGVILYQEQTMKATQLLAGFTLAEADGVRKAIGKKDMEKMKKVGNQFIEQAQAGWIEVKLEDGTTRQFHRAEHFKCADGKLRTIEEAMHDGADVLGI